MGDGRKEKRFNHLLSKGYFAFEMAEGRVLGTGKLADRLEGKHSWKKKE